MPAAEEKDADLLSKTSLSSRCHCTVIAGPAVLRLPVSCAITRVCHLQIQNGAFLGSIFSASMRFIQCLCGF